MIVIAMIFAILNMVLRILTNKIEITLKLLINETPVYFLLMAPTTIHREAVLQIGPCNDFSILYGGMWEETFLPTHFIHSSYSSSLDKYGLDGGNDISFTNPVENIISRQGETEMLSLRGFLYKI